MPHFIECDRPSAIYVTSLSELSNPESSWPNGVGPWKRYEWKYGSTKVQALSQRNPFP